MIKSANEISLKVTGVLPCESVVDQSEIGISFSLSFGRLYQPTAWLYLQSQNTGRDATRPRIPGEGEGCLVELGLDPATGSLRSVVVVSDGPQSAHRKPPTRGVAPVALVGVVPCLDAARLGLKKPMDSSRLLLESLVYHPEPGGESVVFRNESAASSVTIRDLSLDSAKVATWYSSAGLARRTARPAGSSEGRQSRPTDQKTKGS